MIGFVLLMTHAEAQECKAFDELMRGGDAALKLKPPDYRKAIDKYTAAWRDCPAQSAKARAAMIKVFDEINLLKDKALVAEKKAQEEKERAQILADGVLSLLKSTLPHGETNVFAYYIQQADTAFAKGNYKDAIRLYQVTILLPEGMQNEKKINAKITNAQQCINLLNKARKMVFDLKLNEAVNLYTQLLQTNPADSTAQYSIETFSRPQTKDMLTDLKLITVKGGEFMMGNDDESGDDELVYNLKLSDYQITTTEITNAQFARFMNEYSSITIKTGQYAEQQLIYECEWGVKYDSISNAWQPQQTYENHPVVNVTWFGAYEYCKFYGLNLPTEAQWEFAARGGDVGTRHGVSLQYAGSNNIDSVAWYDENSESTTHKVATKAPNQLGLYDMSGNVYEWCYDWYEYSYYSASSENNLKLPAISSSCVCRGGSWGDGAYRCHTASRSYWDSSGRYDFLGFRAVLVT